MICVKISEHRRFWAHCNGSLVIDRHLFIWLFHLKIFHLRLAHFDIFNLLLAHLNVFNFRLAHHITIVCGQRSKDEEVGDNVDEKYAAKC